jgi:hypothetical protein
MAGEEKPVPEETDPAPVSNPRPARRALRVAVLACVGAAALAAVGVVWLYQARRATLETNAIGSMRAYAEAQVAYHKNDWDGNGIMEYAHSYTELLKCRDTTGTPIGLIDAAFASAQLPEDVLDRRYVFQDMKTIAGKPINWVDDFALCATPAQYGKTGYRTFIIAASGTTWGKDLGRSEFVTDYPADPAAAGWRIAE